MSTMHSASVSRTSARLIPVHGQSLPLEACRLTVSACAGIARVKLVQRFVNPHAEPLSVTYKLPLPADSAVGGFSFRIGDRRICGTIDGRKQARERFERAVVEGRSAALLEQDRSSLFTQEIGNIPPGQAVEAEIDIDQPLAWLEEGSWEWRFPLAAAPRYLGGSERSVPGDVSIDIADGDIGARAGLELTIRDAVAEGRSPESPSHPLVCSRKIQGFNVELGSGNKVQLDRDVVVRWPAAAPEPGASIDVARPAEGPTSNSAYAVISVVPPAPGAHVAAVPRDLTLLIDTSGSMSGEPLQQAKRVACALVDSLGDADQLELIEFSNQATSFLPQPQPATSSLKVSAIHWIKKLQASGGTEMLSGVQHAMRELRTGSQRQIVLITDGLVGFEREIVCTLLAKLPSTARMHALGVGSAVNRSLLAPIARAGRGIEAIIGLGEDPERAAARILARTAAPAVVDLLIEGPAVRSVVPSRPSDCYAGSPLRAGIELDPAGGEITVRGRTASGAFVRHLKIAAVGAGEGSPAIIKTFARERVEDLEMRVSSGEDVRAREAEIERTGIDFAIATRFTSWVAISEEVMVDPRDPSRHVTQPNALAHGLSAEGLGLREAQEEAPVLAGGYVGAPMAGQNMNMTRSRRSQALQDRAGMAPSPPPPPPYASAAAAGGMGPPALKSLAQPAPVQKKSQLAEPVTRYAPAEDGDADDALAAPEARRLGSAVPMMPGGSPKKEAARLDRGYAEEKDEAPPAPEDASFFERAKRKVQGFLGSRAEEKKPEPIQKDVADKKAAPVSLQGRIVSRTDDGELVIEVKLITGVELALSNAKVTLRLADGSVEEAEIVVDRSTREGQLALGAVFRLVVRRKDGATTPRVTSCRVTLRGLTIDAS